VTAPSSSLRHHPARILARRRWSFETCALVVVATLLTLRAEWPILTESLVFQPDAQIHTFWMRRFQDPTLFTDPLTRALINAGYVPVGVQSLYHAASYLVDPVVFGPWLAVVLAPFSAWLVFRIVREHTDWRPAAWMGALLFLLPVESLRFSGGHARAFAQPIVLLTVYLLIRGRVRLGSVVPAAGALFYPPAAVSALAVVVASCLTWSGRRPSFDRGRVVWAGAGTALMAAALLLPRLGGHQGSLISASQARAYPDFGPGGQMRFFVGSILGMLKGQYSGINTTPSLSMVLLTPIVLLALRPANLLLLRREVLSMAVTSLVLFALSYAVLFRLYLPNRYTYPLLPFACIAIAIGWRPTVATLARWVRPRWMLVPAVVAIAVVVAYLAVAVVPLGPELSRHPLDKLVSGGVLTMACWVAVGVVACLVMWRSRSGLGPAPMVALAAVLAGAVLLGELAVAGGGRSITGHCPLEPRALHYIGTLPKNAIIAGDPTLIGCVTMVSERPVVISRKLYQVFDPTYFRIARARMFAMINAYYGNSLAKIVALRERYGASYLVVRPGTLHARRPSLGWVRMTPYTQVVARLLRSPGRRAPLHLPARCKTWHDDVTEVYDLRCVVGAASS
jgi:hypothetical protein